MKRIICAIIGAIFVITCAFACACGEDKSEESVNLVAIEANSVGLLDDVDYYVVPEPAATAKSKAIDLNFVGDLQSLYAQSGYPQAVVVAKSELIGTAVLDKFVKALSLADEWLMDENNSVETIASTISSHLTQGLTPSVNAKNLTKTVIQNCSINFVSSSECKQEVISFMQKFNEVSDNSFGVPEDTFFADGANGTAEYTSGISVYAPDGAPALGLVPLILNSELQNISYNIVNANVIQTFVGGDGKADICVLPVNLAVKLLGGGQKYKFIGTLTHGNLFIMSKDDKKITSENLSSLCGKTVGVVNLAQVPGLTFKLILKNHGINYSQLQ